MRTDRVDLEVLNNRFAGIVTEMGRNIWRASFTPFVKEAWDFGMGLVSPDGEMFAYSKDIGVSMMVAAPFDQAVRAVSDLRPGDVIISNDPYIRSGGLASHLPDIQLLKPFFVGDEIVCFIWTFIHSSDIGGIVPGSISPRAVDIYQEGLRIPPLKLFKAGILNADVMELFLANSRIPLPNRGDLNALCSAMDVAERRLSETVERYGLGKVRDAISDLLDYAESFSRAVIERIPDGTYRFHDYLELDLIDSPPARISVAVTVSGNEMTLDFAGTDPQVPAAFNLPTFGRNHHFLTGGLAGFFLAVMPQAPLNKGLWRPIKVAIPDGTILTPAPPAAVGVRYATGQRALETVLGALSKACDGGEPAPGVSGIIPAAGCGLSGVMVMSVFDESAGERIVTVVSALGGGSGARPCKDGIDGTDVHSGARNIPAEVIETELPVIVRHCRLRTDGPAAGRWRGGLGRDLCVEARVANSILTARGWERGVLPPWGRLGGEPAKRSELILYPGTAKERRIGKIDVLQMDPGDAVRFITAGGAGFGDPFMRDPERVLQDVEDEYITIDDARHIYGVVISADGVVDGTATGALRRARRTVAPSDFSFGAERDEFERIFPTALHDQLLDALERRVRPEQRHYYLRKAYEALSGGDILPVLSALVDLLPETVVNDRSPAVIPI